MDVNDPAVRRLVASLRAGLAAYDRDSAGKPDRHVDECSCPFCAFVRANRELVELFDDLDPKGRN